MSSGQWRVLLIIAAILGVEAATSQAVRDNAKSVLAGKGLQANAALAPGALIGFALAALALVAIAAWQDGLATGIALLFLLLVLINRGSVIGPALQGAASKIGQVTNTQGSNGGK